MVDAKLTRILASHPTLKIATMGGRVSPWIAAAFFAEDGLFALELMIETRGKTMANIVAEARVAVMVEDGDALAPFAQGEGYAILPGDAAAAARFRADLIAKTPASAALVSLPHLVPVRIDIDRWLVTDVPAGWLPARELRRAQPEGVTSLP